MYIYLYIYIYVCISSDVPNVKQSIVNTLLYYAETNH